MDLYHPLILQHNRNPVNFEKMDNADIVVEAYNEICGDQFKIYLKVENNFIKEITFYGYGCAVSKASTSMLVQVLKGSKLEAGISLIDRFLTSFNNVNKSFEHELTPDGEWENMLEVLKVAKKYPGREKCATLSWDAISEQLIS